MRVHRLLAEGSVGVLREVFDEGRVLDRALDEAFRANPKWGKRDRGFLAETVFEVVRWRRALAFVAADESLEAICAAQWRRAGLEVPEWWRWNGCGLDEMAAREKELGDQSRAVRESVPDWLDEIGEQELGESWGLELAALNRRARVFLRVNPLLTTLDEAVLWLAEAGVPVERVEGAPDALVLPEGKILPKLLAQDGRVEIQDAGSQQIVPLLGVEPGMRVVDTCAGAGGKTLQMAGVMGNRGEIIALDTSERKLVELKKRVARSGARNVRIEPWQSDSLRRRSGWADRVLIDAPCSGLGTLKRQPDLKWRIGPEALQKTIALQAKLLDRYRHLLKPDGQLVYATCSVLPSENTRQVRALLERGAAREIEAELSVSPATSGWDGFYAARLG
ncbi:MAG: methyltransferase domain-containing protein [Verrucomicrobia bacterium]|nr:MAG: methyltransferase domain-containing protein [Verrucomicrobiota bacterium]TAE89290.1 MAG: methyltransferase domain-containing protein [Verrucomicrobiota bacterium]TAF27836.1 MAG: methyltransferase domain-containing protein [Verrucomicrobiota bacterium]TAF42685.1 MAG: methyltransferase domain-containing protein [Verrucomicrobiota bacterium]